MEPGNELKKLRQQIRQIDEELMNLVARRQQLAREVGETKLASQLPIKDFKVEKEVIESSRKRARELGINEDAAEEITKTLIKYSCQVQEEYQGRARARAAGSRRKIAIVGGLGLMGRWLARFLESFGHAVSLQDVRAAESSEFPLHATLEAAVHSSEIVILATPISVTAALLDRLTALEPKGLIFDICSLKTPLLPAIDRARQAGVRIGSVHPMFGPSAQWLAGRNVLICDTGDEAVTAEAESLFRESTANLVRIPLRRHDELMGYILGLSHLTNLVFGGTLDRSELAFSELRAIASTTFHAQTEVAVAVAAENPDLYFEIQSANSHTAAVLQTMKEAMAAYADAITQGDRAAFKALMDRGARYFRS